MALTLTSRSCRRRWRPQALPGAAASLVVWLSCCLVNSKAASSCSCTETEGGSTSESTYSPRERERRCPPKSWGTLGLRKGEMGGEAKSPSPFQSLVPSPHASGLSPPVASSGAGPAHTTWSTGSGKRRTGAIYGPDLALPLSSLWPRPPPPSKAFSSRL